MKYSLWLNGIITVIYGIIESLKILLWYLGSVVIPEAQWEITMIRKPVIN